MVLHHSTQPPGCPRSAGLCLQKGPSGEAAKQSSSCSRARGRDRPSLLPPEAPEEEDGSPPGVHTGGQETRPPNTSPGTAAPLLRACCPARVLGANVAEKQARPSTDRDDKLIPTDTTQGHPSPHTLAGGFHTCYVVPQTQTHFTPPAVSRAVLPYN